MNKIQIKDAIQRFSLAMDNDGAFLNVQDKQGSTNVMSIGWGLTGISWGRSCLTLLVNPGNYSHHFMIENPVFTVSIPKPKTMTKALTFCGTKSGRDITDKYQEAGLITAPAQTVDCKIITQCPTQIECHMLYIHDIIPELLDNEIITGLYRGRTCHTIFYSEIVSAYEL